MKKLLMIVGMMLAAATAPVWAAEQVQPATDGKNPPATIAWGEAVALLPPPEPMPWGM